ncbi:MAG: acetylxylan esterase [bacterium]|nr:acetylxylan esterase [bacterium]
MSPDLRESTRFGFAFVRIAAQVKLDEQEVPSYRLPDLLAGADGRPITTAEEWREGRRGEILSLFRDQVYGHAPEPPPEYGHFEERETGTAFSGAAVRRQLSIPLAEDSDAPALELLLYLPAERSGPVPVFLGINFWGNQSTSLDSGVRLSERWLPNDREHGVRDHRATEASRGTSQSRWPIEFIVSRGYGVATFYRGDAEPDHPEGHRTGVRAIRTKDIPTDKTPWGTLGAWAWSLSRALDTLVTTPGVDAERVIVIGHSRLGKAALWAAAQDERFAMAISNDSGCMGAALSRRRFGETIAFVNMLFPHWFPPAFDVYSEDEDALPIDQHMLLALIAPRPLYVASASEDLWADPRGEFLSAHAAGEVYHLLGEEGLPDDEMPAPGEDVMARIGYHLRAGKHDITQYDWERFLKFADQHIR